MVRLLVIADDFTGALDTGIQFAEYGAATRLLTATEIDGTTFPDGEAEVLVIDAETRHLSSKEAYRRVYRLTRQALEDGVRYVYKKTDSGLRGNIGSELKAVMDASGENFLAYLPALPEMNRVTVRGIHYIEGIPIAETEFGKDPFEPVTSSAVLDLFREEDVPVKLYPRQDFYQTKDCRGVIGIFDSETQEDIQRIAAYLQSSGQLRVMAGCAGFAAVLPGTLGLRKRPVCVPALRRQMLIACGSMNPITRRQIEYGEALGYRRVIMTPEQQLEEGYLDGLEGRRWLEQIDGCFRQSDVVMIDTGVSGGREAGQYRKDHGISLEQARIRIAERIGNVLKKLLEKNCERTLMIVGGDTLMGFVSQTDCREITPVCEVEPGTVLSSMKIGERSVWVITKSGGFGGKELFQTIVEKIEVWRSAERTCCDSIS